MLTNLIQEQAKITNQALWIILKPRTPKVQESHFRTPRRSPLREWSKTYSLALISNYVKVLYLKSNLCKNLEEMKEKIKGLKLGRSSFIREMERSLRENFDLGKFAWRWENGFKRNEIKISLLLPLLSWNFLISPLKKIWSNSLPSVHSNLHVLVQIGQHLTLVIFTLNLSPIILYDKPHLSLLLLAKIRYFTLNTIKYCYHLTLYKIIISFLTFFANMPLWISKSHHLSV